MEIFLNIDVSVGRRVYFSVVACTDWIGHTD